MTPNLSRMAFALAAVVGFVWQAPTIGAQISLGGGCKSGSGTHISLSDTDKGGKRTSMMLVVDKDYCFEVRSRGAVTWNDDDTDVSAIEADGYLYVTEARGGTTHRIEFEEKGGRVARRYWVNGAERSASDAEAWARTLLPRIARESSIGADARVARILRQRGTAGVIAELSEIRSESVKEIYVNALLADSRMTPSDTRALARALPKMFSSDSKRRAIMTSLVSRSPRDGELLNTIVDGTRSISSDRQRAEVLTLVLQQPDLSQPLILSALRSTWGISSDREKANVLVKVAEQRGSVADSDVRREFLNATRTISSSREYRRVMEAVAR